MHWIRNVSREIFGLFVEDGSFAVTVLAWIGLARVLKHWTKAGAPNGLILFAGLALILVASVIQFARRWVSRSQTRSRA